jgi:two-component system, chemotaxis family, sensor kinase CheA
MRLSGAPLRKPAYYDQLMELLANPDGAGISDDAHEPISPPHLGDILVAGGKAARADVDAAIAMKGEQPLGVALLKSNAASLPDIAQALRLQQRIASGDKPVADSSVRVQTERLDRLVNLVGELVIAQAMVTQDEIVARGQHELARKVAHADKIIRELQDLSLAMRMVPLKATFQKMARLVRDLAHKSGKLVEFITEGEETEIDRHMVDIVADPLVHMIRNAIDHGLELPDLREQQGKSRKGSVRLAAHQVGGNVVVELQDDGRGLNRDKIIAKRWPRG